MELIKQLGKSTSEEKEILNITLEECAEVIQCISKVLRFGWDSSNPSRPFYTNRDHMTEEIGDLLCMFQLMFDRGIIDEDVAMAHAIHKLDKLKKFSNINFNLGE